MLLIAPEGIEMYVQVALRFCMPLLIAPEGIEIPIEMNSLIQQPIF